MTSVMLLPTYGVATLGGIAFIINVLFCVYVARKFDTSKALYFLLLCDAAQTSLGCVTVIGFTLFDEIGNAAICWILTLFICVTPLNFHLINMMTSFLRFTRLDSAFNPLSSGPVSFIQEKSQTNQAVLLFGIISFVVQGTIIASNAIFRLKLFPVYSYCMDSQHDYSRKWINILLFGIPFNCALLATFYYDIKSLLLVRRKRDSTVTNPKNRSTKRLLHETPFRSSILNFCAVIYEALAFCIHVFYDSTAKEETMICLAMFYVFCILKSPSVIGWTFYTNEINRRKDHQEETELKRGKILEEALLRKVEKEEDTVVALENEEHVQKYYLEKEEDSLVRFLALNVNEPQSSKTSASHLPPIVVTV